MPETLLTTSAVTLYGREVTGLSVDVSGHTALGDNLFVKKQAEASGAKFARIYAFSYEGQYYVLPKPAIFLVHGDGVAADHVAGVAAKEWDFVGDIEAWTYDKADFSIRLDVETGPLDRILLEEAVSHASQSGSKAHMDGSKAHMDGSKVHLGGSKVHLRG